jgi:hypothetical protein
MLCRSNPIPKKTNKPILPATPASAVERLATHEEVAVLKG